jgi:ADP-heptose:LPS heptosyltransferase
MLHYTTFPHTRKIAVFRATALGDFLFALPALDALHRTYPAAELIYLGREWHARFLPGRLPGPHRVIVVPAAPTLEQIVRGMVIDPAAEEEFFAAMQAEGLDLAIQMHGGGEYSNPFVRRLGARHTVGLKSPRAEALDRWIPYGYYQNETARLLEVVGLAGAALRGLPAETLLPRLPVLESDRAEATPALDALGGPFAALHPGSTDPRRRWSPEKWAAVGDALAARGLRIALTGTAMEAQMIEAVAQQMRAPALNLCDRLSLGGLAGLLAQAHLFAGNDSGPLHLALAVGARTVGLFWSEYIVNSLPLLRGRFAPLIAWRRDCPHCGRALSKAEADSPQGECRHEVSMVEEILPEDVTAAAEMLLAA